MRGPAIIPQPMTDGILQHIVETTSGRGRAAARPWSPSRPCATASLATGRPPQFLLRRRDHPGAQARQPHRRDQEGLPQPPASSAPTSIPLATALAPTPTPAPDALSVLTDEPFFQGKLQYLADVRQAVPLPVLRKDFIIDPWQVYESRAAGADAVLLIAECLELSLLSDLQILATELNMILPHRGARPGEPDARKRPPGRLPLHKSYSLLGINNRADLCTFKTDLGTTLRLAELVEDRSVLVSESGISTPTGRPQAGRRRRPGRAS